MGLRERQDEPACGLVAGQALTAPPWFVAIFFIATRARPTGVSGMFGLKFSRGMMRHRSRAWGQTLMLAL